MAKRTFRLAVIETDEENNDTIIDVDTDFMELMVDQWKKKYGSKATFTEPIPTINPINWPPMPQQTWVTTDSNGTVRKVEDTKLNSDGSISGSGSIITC